MEKREVPIEEAIERIGTDAHIHTFRSASFGLLGADWDRQELIDAMREHGVEEAGAQACAMGHTLVIVNIGGSPLFIEAKPQAGRDAAMEPAKATAASKA